VNVFEEPSEKTAMTHVRRAPWGYIVVVIDHTSRQMTRPLLANSHAVVAACRGTRSHRLS
jgi:hypothetical protein